MSLSPLVNDQMARAESALAFLPTRRSSIDIRHNSIADALELETLFPQPVECIQLSPGDFNGTVSSLSFDAFTFFEHSCNSGIHLRRTQQDNTLLVGFVEAGQGVLDRGHVWSASQALVIPGDQLDISTLSAADIVWLQVRLDALAPSEREALLALVERTGCFIAGQTLGFVRLRACVTGLLRLCRSNPSILEMETLWKRLRSDILAQLGRALGSGRVLAFDRKAQRRGLALVHRVEQFMWENVEEPLTLERICASMDCGMRSLIYAFKDSFGLGPMAYLKIRRLNAARRKLRATRGETRIFDIAADYGFWHMGHFGADYKRMFGMTASETVANQHNGK